MEEIDLKELFGLFVEKKAQIALIILIFIILGFIYSLGFVTPTYESYTTLLLVKGEDTATTDPTTGVVTDSITTNDVTLNSKLVAT